MFRVEITLPHRPRTSGYRFRLATLASVIALALPVLALAGPVGDLHEFGSGEAIRASEFNDNFEAVADAIDDNDARIAALEGAGVDGGPPSGAVLFFEGEQCPVGWSEVDEARGRALVGLGGSAGTLAGTVGEPLEDLENRAHSHTVGVSNVPSGDTSVNHTHGVPGATTSPAGEHNHQWRDGASTTFQANGTSLLIPAPLPYTTGSTTGSSVMPWNLDVDFYTNEVADHTHSVTSRTSSFANQTTSHGHTMSFSTTSASARTADVLPYVQLLVCRRD